MVELITMTSSEFTVTCYATVRSSADHSELLIILSRRATLQANIKVGMEILLPTLWQPDTDTDS